MPPTTPRCTQLDAAPHWRVVDFISDLHLQASEVATFDAWVRYLHNTPADAVFMLGDLFEVWVGDDAADEPGAFAVYTYPPQQRKRLLANDIVTMYAECPTCDADMIDFARAIERAHGITGEQK